MQDMCAEKPRHPVPRQDHVMAAWRGQEAVGVVVSPTVRARPHRESCLFGDDVVRRYNTSCLVGCCAHCLFL